ncbi:DNA (cytosine-5)-methyltransferase DRM1 [Triticum aestivum]|uniref:DNA (cytosine-5)-methyltransferase DRM1 n=1 Tax=Triticum aestivum TaxID=4565 RepID=UPI001D02B439|nr:DNA (cytosine-5)-methyltransferase DRM1-like [Triticum aestivum]
MHGGGTSTRDGDGELRARGFHVPQHRSTAARGLQLAQHRGSAGRSLQLSQHRGSTSASADATDGGRKPPPMPPVEEERRGFHLCQHRGSTSASADATDGGRNPPPPPPQDLSDRPGSSRHVLSGSTDLMVALYIEMGFPAAKVAMALEHTGGQVEDEAILDWLINHEETDLEGSSSPIDLEGFSSSSSDLEVFGSSRDLEAFGEELTEREKKLWTLVEMGFTEEEASSAIDICGVHEQDSILADAVLAAQIFKRDNDSAESVLLDTPQEPPYFYFENVERAPKGVWDEMSRCLYNLAPEYVDSKDFCAATRKRGYIHNLPVKGRFRIQPMQQTKIQEKFPRTKQWWPAWDTRTQLNCIQTVMAPTTASNRVREILSDCDGTPSEANQKNILNLCKCCCVCRDI